MSDFSIKIERFRPDARNTRRGFFNCVIGDGIVIRECVLHVSFGKWWVALPSRKYEKDGRRQWFALVAFTEDGVRKQFQEECVATLRVAVPEVFTETGGPGSAVAGEPARGNSPEFVRSAARRADTPIG